ncbi:glycosyltransferase family 2 protein [Geopsychrobacter electrodiphilus]|uniref:glycosyltransferase family 2 protein n=1 Tax=Geopsychrobacter electrodiphilus TaxID=225196 RepID=UPI00037B642C|nr:glycosyltransferase family 2 protein [Geopsychrobacter electrodiphilus]
MEKISFVVPIYNEEDNLRPLAVELQAVAADLGAPCEFLLVDDCSSDKSLELIKQLAAEDERFKYLSFARNAGQSAAMWAGFQNASGDVIITLDADLQNDPADLREMIKHYGDDYQMVTGWRYSRQDSLSKKLASKLGNGIRNWVTADNIHDTGCSLKIMNAAMLKRVRIYKGLHRFLPTLMRLEGACIKEVKVNHRPRLHGESKYTNLRRGIEGLYDLIAVRWMMIRNLRIEIEETNVRH